MLHRLQLPRLGQRLLQLELLQLRILCCPYGRILGLPGLPTAQPGVRGPARLDDLLPLDRGCCSGSSSTGCGLGCCCMCGRPIASRPGLLFAVPPDRPAHAPVWQHWPCGTQRQAAALRCSSLRLCKNPLSASLRQPRRPSSQLAAAQAAAGSLQPARRCGPHLCWACRAMWACWDARTSLCSRSLASAAAARCASCLASILRFWASTAASWAAVSAWVRFWEARSCVLQAKPGESDLSSQALQCQ